MKLIGHYFTELGPEQYQRTYLGTLADFGDKEILLRAQLGQIDGMGSGGCLRLILVHQYRWNYCPYP